MKIKWHPIFTARTPTLFQWYIFEGEKKKYFKDVLNLDTEYTSGKNVLDEIAYDLYELIAMESLLSSKIDSNPNFIINYIQTCYKKCNYLISISKKIGIIKKFKNLENKVLLALYKRYQAAVLETMPFMTTPMVIDSILKKKMVNLFTAELGIKDKAKQELLMSNLIIPKKKNYFVKEQDDLLKMAIKLQKNININREVEKHLAQYAWTSTNVYLGKYQGKEDINKKLQEILKKDPRKVLARLSKDKKEALKHFKEALNLVKKCSGIDEIINWAREFLFLQTHKMEVLFYAHFNILPLFEEISKRFGTRVEELIYLTGDEIIGLLDGTSQLDRKLIKERMKNVSIIKEHNKLMIFSGDDKRKVTKRKIKTMVIKGSVACRGRAIGKAKLLFEEEDMAKINSGDIIVSPMTRPHFVPAMKKAGGIVTDFGGVLCHAALISREFSIPCIVGTTYATKVFKDGDTVELNAYEGIARKI